MATITTKKLMFTLGEIKKILGSTAQAESGLGDPEITSIVIDSRIAGPDSLFIAVKGENHDGHDFIDTAFSNGAAAAVISNEQARARELHGEKYIVVDDTIYTLGELARYYRDKITANIVTVTGSNGKTTVKNLIYEILLKVGPSIKSEKNFNNLFGLPLSIFRLDSSHKSAVFELGMSAPGEISRLGEISSPNVAVITNVGPAHLEFFANVDEIADAKLEIQNRIKADGYLVINGDDRLLMTKVDKSRVNMMTFGLDRSNSAFPENLKFDKYQRPEFTFDGKRIRSAFPGVHNVYNLLASLAVGRIMGVSSSDASDAVNAYKPSDMRSEIVEANGVVFIVDCYNANPISMKYAIDILARIKATGRRIAVLGDMLELGPSSEKYHTEIGAYAKKSGIDTLFCIGNNAVAMSDSFGKGAEHFDDKLTLSEKLIEFIKKGDLVLFKASRGMALEDIYKKVAGEL